MKKQLPDIEYYKLFDLARKFEEKLFSVDKHLRGIGNNPEKLYAFACEHLQYPAYEKYAKVFLN